MPPSAPRPDPRTLGEAVEENAVTLWRTWSAWEGIDCVEYYDRSFVISNIPHPAFNHLYRLRLEPGRAVPFLRDCLEPFRKRSVPCFCWIDPVTSQTVGGRALEEAGLEFSFTAPGMALVLGDLDPARDPPEGVAVTEVRSAADLEAWCGVISEVATFPPKAAHGWLQLHSAIPFGPGEARRHFLAHLGVKPVGAASLLFAHGAAGLFSVAVLPRCRRRGIGTALSRIALKEARASGTAVGTLVSTRMGAGIYRRFGFREVCRWGGWLWSRCHGGNAVI